MNFDTDKVDDYTLALLYLVMHERQGVTRAWKGFDWSTMDRLHEKGLISEPQSKAKSVVVTEEGEQRAAELFDEFFGTQESADDQRVVAPADPLDDPRFETWWEPDELEPLEVDRLDLLELAMEDDRHEMETYLDTQTGAVLQFGPGMNFRLDKPPRESAPDWQKELYEDYVQVMNDTDDRYIEPPRVESSDAWQDMADFVATVADDELRDRLESAIDGKGAFGRFRDIVYGREELSERWHDFNNRRLRWRSKSWLADEGYRLVEAGR